MINKRIADVNVQLVCFIQVANQLIASEGSRSRKENCDFNAELMHVFLEQMKGISDSINQINRNLNARAYKQLEVNDLALLSAVYTTMSNRLISIKNIVEQPSAVKIREHKKVDLLLKTSMISTHTLGKVERNFECLKKELTGRLVENRRGSGAVFSEIEDFRPKSARELFRVQPGDVSDCDSPRLRPFLSPRLLSASMIEVHPKVKIVNQPKVKHIDLRGLHDNVEEVYGDIFSEEALQRDRIMTFIEYLDRSVQTEGLFRESPNAVQLKKVKHKIERMLQKGAYLEVPPGTCVHVVASLLKTAVDDLKYLPTFAEKMMAIIDEPPAQQTQQVMRVFKTTLSREQQEALSALLGYLCEVVKHKAVIKMDVQNLANVIAPCVIKVSKHMELADYMALLTKSNKAFVIMLQAYIDQPDLFYENAAQFE